MCDCFHMVIPPWKAALPEAQEERDHYGLDGAGNNEGNSPSPIKDSRSLKTHPSHDLLLENDLSFHEDPVDVPDNYRPPPQGSSPVYDPPLEYIDASSKEQLSEDFVRSWKCACTAKKAMATSDVSVTSGSVEEFDADEVVEVLLDKESSKAAAAGATGLEISGGKADGIYIKRIKKNTSAAKSHKIHEGDQILSATVYFDNMKYEDALKILQYSEPYQVGFRLKRKHGTAASDLEASSSFGSADVDVKGLRRTGQGDIHSKKHKKRAKANENVSGEDSEMKSPEIPDVELSMLKLPKIKKPQKSSSLRFSKSSSEYDEELQPQNEAGGEAHFVEGDSPRGKGRKIKLKMPRIHFGGSKTKTHKASYDVTSPKHAGADPTGGELQGEFKQISDVPGLMVKGADAKVEMPSVHVPCTEIDLDTTLPKKDSGVEFPGGKAKGFQLKMPKYQITMPNVSGTDIGVKDMKDPTFQGDINVGIATDKSDVGFEDQGGKPVMPVIKFPKFSIQTTDLNIDDSTSKTEICAPKLDISTDVDVNVKDGFGTHFNMPEASTSKVNVVGPSITTIEGGVSLPKPIQDGEYSITSGAAIKMTDVDTLGPELKDTGMVSPIYTVEKSTSKLRTETKYVEEVDIKGFKIHSRETKLKMPHFHISGPKIDAPDTNIDLNAPEYKADDIYLQSGITGPRVEFGADTSGIDIKGPDGKFKIPKFGISGPCLKDSEINVDSSFPTAKVSIKEKFPQTDVDMTVPKVPIEIGSDIKSPKVGIDAAGPDVNIEGPEGRFKMPQFKMPKIGLSGPGIKGSDIDVDVNLPNINLPKANVNISAPDVELDINAPKGNIDVHNPYMNLEDSETDGRGSKFKMPKFNVSAPKINAPDVSFDFKAPHFKAKTDASTPKLEADYKDSHVDFRTSKGSDANIEAPEGKFHMPNIKMPKIDISAPKLKSTDTNIDVKVPLTDVDISPIPHLKEKVPKADINVESPHVSQKGSEIDGKGFKLKMPDVHLSGPKIQAPYVSLDFKEPETDISVPTLEGDKKGPYVEFGTDIPNVDVEGPEGKFKMPKFKMPKFGMSGQKFKGSDIDEDAMLSKPEIEINEPDLEISANPPDVDVGGLDVELDMEHKGLKFKKPKFNISAPKVNTPHVGIDFKPPHFKTKDDFSPNVEGNIKGPNVDINAETPIRDIEGADKKFKMPNFKMPKVGMSGRNIKDSEMDLDSMLPNVDVDRSVPEMEFDANAQNLKVAIADPNIEREGRKFKIGMPDLHFSGPKLHKPDITLDIQAPKLKTRDSYLTKPEGDIKGPNDAVDIGVPTSEFDAKVKVPEVDLNLTGPDVDLEGPDIKGKKFKFGMPDVHFSGPKIHKPDINFDIKAPKLKGKGDSLPKLEGEFKGPDVDVSVEGPDVEGPDGKLKMPKFKMPKFGISGPKLTGSDIDLNATVPKADIDVSLPDVQLDVSAPDVKVDLDAPDLNLSGPDARGKGFKLKMPEFHISGPKMHGPDVSLDFKAPHFKTKGDISTPKVEGDITGPDLNLDVSLPKGDTAATNVDIDAKVTVPDADLNVTVPDFTREVPDIKGKKFKLSLPDVHFSGPKLHKLDTKGPKLKSKGGSLPTSQGDMKELHLDFGAEGSDIHTESPDGKFKMHKLKKTQFGITGPKLKGSNVDVTLPKTDLSVLTHDITLDSSATDVNLTDTSLEGPGVKTKRLNIKMPDLHLSGPKIHAPDINFDLKDPHFNSKGSVSTPNLEGNVQAPTTEIPKIGSDVEVQGIKGKHKMPRVKLPKFSISSPTVKSPDVDVELQKGDIDILPEHEAHSNLPARDVNVSGPDEELQHSDMKGKKFKLSMPDVKFSGPKIHKPDIKVKSSSLPARESDRGKNLDFNAEEAALDIEISGEKFKIPKVHVPSFDISGPKIHAPDVDISLPKSKIDTALPNLDVNLKSSQGDIKVAGPVVDYERQDIEGKGQKFKLPTLNISGPKIYAPDISIDLKSPKGKGEADTYMRKPEENTTLPHSELSFKGLGLDTVITDDTYNIHKVTSRFGVTGPKIHGPDIDITLPKSDIDIAAPDRDMSFNAFKGSSKITGPYVKHISDEKGINKIQVGEPKSHTPDIDISLKGTKLTDVGNILKPIIGDIKVQETQYTIDEQYIKIGSSEEIKKPRIKMPTIGISGQKMHTSALKMSSHEFEHVIKDPNLKSDVNVHGQKEYITVEGHNVKFDSAGVDGKGDESKPKMPKIKFPKTGGKAVEIGMPEVSDASLDNFCVDKIVLDAPLSSADLSDIGSEDVSVTLDGRNVKVKDGKISFPKLGKLSSKIQDDDEPTIKDQSKQYIATDEESASVQSVEDSRSSVDSKGKKSKFKLPKLGFTTSAPTPNVLHKISTGEMFQGSIDMKSDDMTVDPSAAHTKIDIKERTVHMKGPDANTSDCVVISKARTELVSDVGEFESVLVEKPETALSVPSALNVKEKVSSTVTESTASSTEHFQFLKQAVSVTEQTSKGTFNVSEMGTPSRQWDIDIPAESRTLIGHDEASMNLESRHYTMQMPGSIAFSTMRSEQTKKEAHTFSQSSGSTTTTHGGSKLTTVEQRTQYSSSVKTESRVQRVTEAVIREGMVEFSSPSVPIEFSSPSVPIEFSSSSVPIEFMIKREDTSSESREEKS